MRSRSRRRPTVTVTGSPTRRPRRRRVEVPRTIWCPVRGGWPWSSVGESRGPRPGATPMAGTRVPPIPMIPWSPNDQPVTSRVVPDQVTRLGRCDGPELQVDRGVPGLPVAGGGVHQLEQARAEGEGRGHREHRQRGARQGAAHRHGGPPGAGVEREAGAGGDGHRGTGAGQRRRQPRAAARPRTARCRGPAARADARRQAGHAVHASSTTTMATAPAVSTVAATLTPGSGSARRADPDRHQRRCGHRHRHGGHRPDGPGRAHLDQARDRQLGPGHPERRQRGMVGRGRGELADGGLPDDQQRRDREHQREERERNRLRPDRPLHGGGLGALVGHEDLAAGAGESTRERLCLAPERRRPWCPAGGSRTRRRRPGRRPRGGARGRVSRG